MAHGLIENMEKKTEDLGFLKCLLVFNFLGQDNL